MKQNQSVFFSATISTVLLLAITAFFILLSGASLGDAVASFLSGAFGSTTSIGEILVKATPLIFMGLGCAVAFRTGFFNLGAEGQFYIGALVTTAIGLNFPISNVGTTILLIVCAFVGGGLWAMLAAFLKEKLKISEVITTIMLNYIAINLVGLMIRTVLQDPSGSMPQSAKLDTDMLMSLLFPPTRINAGIFMALGMAVFVWLMMERTTLGYELKAVGFNGRAAKVCGISVVKSVIISALLSGGLAGIAGSVEVLGIQKKLLEGISSDAGYTAILIALLAKNSPIAVVFISLFYATMQVGAASMQRSLGIPAALVNVIMGLIVTCILCKDVFTWKKKEGK